MSIRAVLWKSYSNKEGEHPVYIQVIQNREVIRLRTGLFCAPDHWNEQEGQLNKNHPAYRRANADLATGMARIELFLSTRKNPASKFQLEAALRGEVQTERKKMEFFAFAEVVRERFNNEAQYNTYRRLGTRLKYLEGFVGRKFLPFEDIDVGFLKDFEAHLKKKITIRGTPMKTNTINAEGKVLSMIITAAEQEGIVPFGSNPFRFYKLKKERTKKPWLNVDEMTRIMELRPMPGTDMFHARNCFLLSFNFRGMRFADLCNLKWSDIIGEDRLYYQMGKSRKIINVKLTEEAKTILRQYVNEDRERVFPFLKEELRAKEKIAAWNARINDGLKLVAKQAKIDKNLTTHIARHTWTNLALEGGADLDLIRRSLAHDSLNTTQHYTSDFGQKGLDELNEKVTRLRNMG